MAEKMDEKRTHDMVVCVADRGQAELVMEAAKQAGASGGTVVHARGFNAKEEENFLHLLIRPEKELVLIIVPLADRKTVMQQICDAIAQTTGEAGVASISVCGVGETLCRNFLFIFFGKPLYQGHN